MPDDASACPLAALCTEAEGLLAARARAEREIDHARHGEDAARAARVVREVDLSLADLAARASVLRPSSARGALFALALAAAEAEALGPSDGVLRLRRRLYALAGFIADDAQGARLPGPVAHRFMQIDADPLALLEA